MELQEISGIPSTTPARTRKPTHHRRISSIYLQELRDLCKRTISEPNQAVNRTVEAVASPSSRRIRFVPGFKKSRGDRSPPVIETSEVDIEDWTSS